MTDSFDDLTTWRLKTAGAALHSFLQRCTYLFEHPEGGSDQLVIFSEPHATIVSLLTGAVLDILRTNDSSKHVEMVDSECPDDASAILTLTVAKFDEQGSAGFSWLKRASQTCQVRYTGDLVRIVARITGRSLRRAFDANLPEQEAG